jgi:hypothetical protein
VAQTLDQQNEALAAAGVTKVFSDLMSGARDDRPGLAALLEYVREGDTVVVWKLDRLGRNMLHILQTAKELTGRGVILLSTSDGIDSSTALGPMMIGVVGSLTECKRELTTERAAPKREASKRNEQSSVGRVSGATLHRYLTGELASAQSRSFTGRSRRWARRAGTPHRCIHRTAPPESVEIDLCSPRVDWWPACDDGTRRSCRGGADVCTGCTDLSPLGTSVLHSAVGTRSQGVDPVGADR